MLQHPHIVETRWELRGREADWKRTLVVMTNLPLDPLVEDHDREAENALLDAIAAFWTKNANVIDAVNIRTVEQARSPSSITGSAG